MNRLRRRTLPLILVGLAAWRGAALAAPAEAEARKIEDLIRYIESRQDIRFVRNGSAYTAAQAGRFLRGKLRAMGDDVSTARQFIDQIASKSSTSGKPYTVTDADGHSLPSAQFLGDELARIERKP
ncbi:MAG: DUF5329 family protein [Burkholderiaceae bacterium]